MGALQCKLTPEYLVERNNEISTVGLGDEIGMLHMERGKYYGFDSVGARIWELLDRPRTVKAVIVQLLEEYDVLENMCRTHVLEFMNKLLEEDLVIVHGVEEPDPS